MHKLSFIFSPFFFSCHVTVSNFVVAAAAAAAVIFLL